MTAPKPATSITKSKNARPLGRKFDPQDLERVRRGFIAARTESLIVDDHGRKVVDTGAYDFLRDDREQPDTVNPHLWRHATLNAHHGLFEVAPNIWQVRGYDISNITFIKGATGWVVIDPLTADSTAKASLDLLTKHVENRRVTAVIYTHSHADHFGGVLGVTTKADVESGKCQIIAPVGFLHEAIAENVIAGPAMSRRATYQFGRLLPPSPQGHVDCGLGNSVPTAAPSLLAPTHDITRTGEELVIDGVRIVFQLTPETEAPAEMNFFFPDFGWLCMAENCSHTMHNLVPIRGALVRNALNWSKYINESIELFADKTDVLFTSHNWPRWGKQDVREFLILQRDLYRWIHDQTMRFANHGMTSLEIADLLVLPDEFLAQEHTRGFYGDLVHNVKAVYQRYLSWYDGNPANLNKLTPSQAGARYVELAGGVDALLSVAQKYFDAGDYRWVVELVNHVVFAEPTNERARNLQADALEQLGYQAESSTFRNSYLMGAQELRDGPPQSAESRVRARSLIKAMSIDQVFDTLGLRTISENIGGLSLCVNWLFTDMAGTPDEKWILGLSNRTIYATQGRHDASSVATVQISRDLFLEVIAQTTTFVDELQKGTVTIEGDAGALLTIFGNLDKFFTGFAIVEP
ncbi:MAG: MBL fold metallo-hydrolase [Ilumatobacteraceae bacterium]|nr:MBL fold metallo-hydrolase [Ilumatobacteraceae bacterium]